jgi:hypothetical protein
MGDRETTPLSRYAVAVASIFTATFLRVLLSMTSG